MITDFDDYLIHQAALPINQTGITNRNAYDRYWFNGFDKSGRSCSRWRSAGIRTASCRTRTSAWPSMACSTAFHASRRIAEQPDGRARWSTPCRGREAHANHPPRDRAERHRRRVRSDLPRQGATGARAEEPHVGRHPSHHGHPALHPIRHLGGVLLHQGRTLRSQAQRGARQSRQVLGHAPRRRIRRGRAEPAHDRSGRLLDLVAGALRRLLHALL